MKAVWERSSQGGSALLLLLALADHADDEGLAWPRIRSLAEKIRLTPRYVQKLLQVLTEAGELGLEPYPEDRRRNAYRLLVCPPATGAWRSRLEAVQKLWAGLPAEVERPTSGQVGRWLEQWEDDRSLTRVLRELRSRGHLAVSLRYVETCLATARLQSGRLPSSPTALEQEVQAVRPLGQRSKPQPFDLAGRLTRLSAALPSTLPKRARWSRCIRSLGGSIDRVEKELALLEGELVARLESSLPEEDLLRLTAQADQAIARLGSRLSEPQRPQEAERLRYRLLHQRLNLPQLSLFSPDAERPLGQDPARLAGEGPSGEEVS